MISALCSIPFAIQLLCSSVGYKKCFELAAYTGPSPVPLHGHGFPQWAFKKALEFFSRTR